ncbi:hypothetical protein GQ53DRAFT_786674 [Thozetella sp. PMI_491]|nr:hypothetical protein GQ53DRAFT_786674 [Thozetella sp. PMI_491]
MRLLECDSAGNICLTEEFYNPIPPYAILSHRWCSEEVTFKDLSDGLGRKKAGYIKLEFCAKQARRDGLQYFWVDTCCIDKASSTELSEAINSMFRWYRDAARCYVYLIDVPRGTHGSDWQADFSNSVWFTRGWTLQELIAPASVEFFSRDGERLGDKSSLERQIQSATNIPLDALRGYPLSNFSVPERMSWIRSRETTRDEDKAYSLLGIFDIHMPLLYGEGRERAFRRLEEEIINSSKTHRRIPIPLMPPTWKQIAAAFAQRCKESQNTLLRAVNPRTDR